MLIEEFDYSDELPLRIFISSIDEYPIHMHEILEVIYIIEGEIDLKYSFYNYTLTKGDFFIINRLDLHSIDKKSNSNLIMFFQIDLNKYEKYYPDINKMLIFSSGPHSDNNRSIQEVISLLAKIMQEFINKDTEYRIRIQTLSVKFLHCLINEFQYFSFQDEKIKIGNDNKYKENEFQMKRFHRIVSYIYRNYNKKISLEEISKEENVSKYHLTRILKYGIGTGFQELVNGIRIDRSEVLLLGTNKSIGDIVYECGYSSPKYFNKNFKDYFGMTPSKYRKKYRDKTIKKRKIKYLNYDEEKATEKIADMIKTLEEKDKISNTEEKLDIIQIDFMNKESGKFEHYWNCLNLLDINQGLTLEYQKYLKEYQEDIDLQFIRLNFEGFIEKYNIIDNWEWSNQLLDTLNKVKIIPIITMNYEKFKNNNSLGKSLEVLNNFLNFCGNKYGNKTVNSWQLEVQSDTECDQYNYFLNEINKTIKLFKMKSLKEKSVIDFDYNPLYDTEYMPCFIINNIINNNKNNIINRISLIDYNNDYLTNNSFLNGNTGLIMINELRKPSYYVFYLLSKLGKEMIAKSDGYIITRNKDNIQMLIYNYEEICNNLFVNERTELKEGKNQLENMVNNNKTFILKLTNLSGKYHIKRYKLDKKNGGEYRNWADCGFPKLVSKENKELIRRIAFPKITLSHTKKKNEYDLFVDLEPFDVELIIFEKE